MSRMISFDAHVALYPMWNSERQRLGVDAQGRPLDDDGLIGPLSRGGRYLDRASVEVPSLKVLLDAAIAGARDEGGNDRGMWPTAHMSLTLVDPQAPRNRPGGQQGPHCAGGLSWAMVIAYGAHAPAQLANKTRWSARDFGDLVAAWGSDARGLPVQVGDVLVWQRAGGGGHIAQVAAVDAEHVYCLETNTSRRESATGVIAYKLPHLERGSQRLHMVARPPSWALARRAP
jgi:hypothetical protein